MKSSQAGQTRMSAPRFWRIVEASPLCACVGGYGTRAPLLQVRVIASGGRGPVLRPPDCESPAVHGAGVPVPCHPSVDPGVEAMFSRSSRGLTPSARQDEINWERYANGYDHDFSTFRFKEPENRSRADRNAVVTLESVLTRLQYAPPRNNLTWRNYETNRIWKLGRRELNPLFFIT